MASILIVDDQASILQLLRRILERHGHSVTEAVDGFTALEKVSESRPDLVITDIFMPEMDGLEFLRRLRDLSPRPGVIAMSGGGVMAHDQVLALAEALGASLVLTKPFMPKDVLNGVESVLAGRGDVEG